MSEEKDRMILELLLSGWTFDNWFLLTKTVGITDKSILQSKNTRDIKDLHKRFFKQSESNWKE